ncbi:MAG: hypothetical protein EPN46_06635 [Candidimonas sp.]|nr:MAG: hypothetical protein EPN77_03715 [Candidimonas sp.]TAM25326.1 MAG: hypothetical protein EPN62_04355 [Candidimonas sp.]TAM77323.1 MAG: hypothetical protein EPN46_06635 [Candidimonas sp.]
MFSMPRCIENLIEQRANNLKAIDVQLVSPPRMNGTTKYADEVNALPELENRRITLSASTVVGEHDER